MRGIAHDLWRKLQAVSEHSPKCHSVNSAYQVLFIVCSGFLYCFGSLAERAPKTNNLQYRQMIKARRQVHHMVVGQWRKYHSADSQSSPIHQ